MQAGITAGKAAANAAAAAEENADSKTNVAAATGAMSTAAGSGSGSAATASGGPGANNALAEGNVDLGIDSVFCGHWNGLINMSKLFLDRAVALRKAKEAADALSQSLGGDGRQRALEVINNLNKSRPGAPGAGGAGDAAGSMAGSGGPGGPGGPGGHRDNGFAIEIEINDYPPKARLMVIQKMMIDQISDHSGAAITTRGVFVEQGKQPPPGERKLYLFIEGDSQLVIDKAKNEITRILREEANKAADATNRGGGPGRGGGGRFQIV